MNTWTTNLTPPNKKKNKKPWPHNKNDPQQLKRIGQLTSPKRKHHLLFPPNFFGTLPFPSLHNAGAHQGEEFTLETRQFRSQHRQQDQGGEAVGIAAVRPIPLKPLEKPDQPETPFGWGCWNWQHKIPRRLVKLLFFFCKRGLFFRGSLEDFSCVAKTGGCEKNNPCTWWFKPWPFWDG